MAILSSIWNALTGNTQQEKETVTDRPCANCPSDCAIAGTACSLCSPYKKQLIDVLYQVNHLDEYYAGYEVAGTTVSGGVQCPFCGAKSENPFVCDYCGSQLSEGSGKIKVASYSDIPNPIMQAQNIIYERYETIVQKNTASGSESSGIFSQLTSLLGGSSLLGSASADESDQALGAKMSEDEIKEAASLYGVSIADYLQGLDNGKYLTLSGKQAHR